MPFQHIGFRVSTHSVVQEEVQQVALLLREREVANQAAEQLLQQSRWKRESELKAREIERRRRKAEVDRNRKAAEAQVGLQ
jgi:hypothetical protein